MVTGKFKSKTTFEGHEHGRACVSPEDWVSGVEGRAERVLASLDLVLTFCRDVQQKHSEIFLPCQNV